LQAAIDEAERRKAEKHALKERRAEGAAIKKRLDEQCAINARQLKALPYKRNEYQVILFINITALLRIVIFVCLQREEVPRSSSL
jgi:hypothetical protein